MRGGKQKGFAAVGVFLVLGGVIFVWFIFITIMDFIGSKHARKRMERQKRNEERIMKARKKRRSKVHRSVKGYQVHIN